MEQNLSSFVRTILFMIKKNISKRKLLLDLNLIMKRGKIAGKALQNLMMLHHHDNRRSIPPPPTQDYEFSCTNTPVYPLSLFTTHKKHHRNHSYKTTSSSKKKDSKPPVTNNVDGEHDQIFYDPAVVKALEILTSAAASPAVPVFGKSPVVRQLRVTDSPFPLGSYGEEESWVDEAAEKFIMKFYKELRRQN